MDFRIWLLPILAMLGFEIYDLNLQEMNAYYGFVPLELGFESVTLGVVWLGLAAIVFPAQIRSPSDLFLAFYVLISVIWGAFLWPETGLLSLEQGLLMLFLLYFPAFSILAARRFIAPIAENHVIPIYLFRRDGIHIPLVVLLGAVGITSFLIIGQGGFGLDTVYERRLAGRDALSQMFFLGYALNMAVNGAAPLAGFVAGWRRSLVLFLAVLCFAVFTFWILGLKSPIINIIALGGVGFVLRYAKLRRYLPLLMVSGAVALYGYVFFSVWDGSYSAIADYFVRRLTLVQPQVQSYYLHAWFALEPGAKLFGSDIHGYADWTFLIGGTYLGSPDTNANTNAFFYSLLRSGIVGYLIAVAVLSAFNVCVDALFAHTRMPELVAISGLYGILISEQAYTTALLSSGIFLCLVLIVLFSYPSHLSNPKLIWTT
ncbi:MAG: hypothetical protein JJ911_09340 [Rhizobiaceae bacterium]|uniref:hypothetical protein n=1 Tax=Parvibaculum sp. TaxID=2024848 RepID=UPI001B0496AA|nr:hypothetical protein [Parvibaculum sp.]MBO6633381.1 hypothetical protein [Parvibaculum sp.]MBO6725850.1 hypothetical protein [Rhizobiaceae bacterium]